MNRQPVHGLAPCEGEGCGVMTRPSKAKKDRYPDDVTVQRKAKGLCSSCYDKWRYDTDPDAGPRSPVAECVIPGCDTMTRSSRDTVKTAPGTHQRYGGVCKPCHRAAQTIPDTEETPKLAATRDALDGYLAARRRRITRTYGLAA